MHWIFKKRRYQKIKRKNKHDQAWVWEQSARGNILEYKYNEHTPYGYNCVILTNDYDTQVHRLCSKDIWEIIISKYVIEITIIDKKHSLMS